MPVLTDERLALLRYTTKQYIQDDPTEVIIMRQTKVSRPGGGHVFPKNPIAPQIFRFVNQDITGGAINGSDDGTARRFTYVLIGEHDADLDVNDTWEIDDQQYKIDAIIPNNQWESRAYVTCFTKEPIHG